MSRAFKPTAEQRERVELMISYGVPEAEICPLIKNPETGKLIEVETLLEHFAREIATGATKLKSLPGNRIVAAIFGRDGGRTDELTRAKLLMLFAEHQWVVSGPSPQHIGVAGLRRIPDARRGGVPRIGSTTYLRRDGYIVRNVPTAPVGSTGVAVLLGASVG